MHNLQFKEHDFMFLELFFLPLELFFMYFLELHKYNCTFRVEEAQASTWTRQRRRSDTSVAAKIRRH